MVRQVFYSFHYVGDAWRTSQIRNAGTLEGNPPVSDNAWESIALGGKAAIENWIDDQMSGRSCVIVLIGADTANRPYINYEIIKGWNSGKGVLGIYINRLLDSNRRQSMKGANPFDYITFQGSGERLSTVAAVYDTPTDSRYAYNYIVKNLSTWVEDAIKIRKGRLG